MPMQARRGGIARTHSQSSTRGRWVGGTTFRPIYTGRDLVGGPRSPSERTEIWSPPGFGPRTVQPVTIPHTEYVILAAILLRHFLIFSPPSSL
jgi:hypothetical protein